MPATKVAPAQSIIVGYRTAHVPDELQGRVHSAVNLLGNAVTPLAPTAVGALVTSDGYPTTDAALPMGALAMMARHHIPFRLIRDSDDGRFRRGPLLRRAWGRRRVEL
ncbi:hypothetical protein [Streptomyces gilvosporeus]|uniref:Uncharacterized protein n=1 Tax=Streptomyces gilvosporeus TaxID=553510 RepID=A0A1V0U0R5_9ACTN|nr:hypothetical protein [Streptomyces gilvosporeus]ARF58766.1 hypothetical protein B1H19_35380 [Streptomyces gilvosporeus]